MRAHYEAKGRPEAARNLLKAIDDAERRIESLPSTGLPAPRPYPFLNRPGRLWMKCGRYWIGYEVAAAPLIVAVFHDTADIPGRI